ncbi:MAG TPA: SLBB domain-containing protein [Gemmatimonadales bacterium]|jgi:protein involved in polysaccharide export with SLBB domain|nr:SLBB domain-containing protein [Gemmatimonadales bacterium]
MRPSRWLLGLALAVMIATPAMAQMPAPAFQVGDRVLLRVEGDSALSDTFTVVAGPALQLPDIGEISLAGVRRTDLESHLQQALRRYIKDAVVHARALIRVSVVGEVARPGFYAVPIDLVLPDALMLAGGATQTARVDKLRVMRGTTALWDGDRLQAAVAQGSTLDQLGIQAGDRIQVPGDRDPESKWRIAGILVTSLATVVTVVALTHHH